MTSFWLLVLIVVDLLVPRVHAATAGESLLRKTLLIRLTTRIYLDVRYLYLN